MRPLIDGLDRPQRKHRLDWIARRGGHCASPDLRQEGEAHVRPPVLTASFDRHVAVREPIRALLTRSKGLYPITLYPTAEGEKHGHKG
jgi:hypothetical protein